MAEQSSAMLRVLKARARIAQTQVFFASTIYGANLIETKEAQSCRTNGIDIQFNPNYINAPQITDNVEGLLLHEVLHCALNHLGRRQGRDKVLWNQACDYSINPLISQYFRLPPGALLDQRFSGKSPERIYEILKLEQQENKKGKEGKGGGRGSEPMYDAEDSEETAEADQKWKRTTTLAAEKAQKAGEVHGHLKELLDQLFAGDALDWKNIIRDMARDSKENTARSWARPYRRLLATGMIWPGPGDDKISKLVLCIDSSGSINSDVLLEMKAEAMGLLEQSLVDSIVMISTDTKVCSKEIVTTSEEAGKFDLGHHGGGTDFRHAMDEVGKHKEAMGCIFFTDMETNSFGVEPEFPVVWVNWGRPELKAPYGRTALYKK